MPKINEEHIDALITLINEAPYEAFACVRQRPGMKREIYWLTAPRSSS